jgi:hypothetical protein
MLILTKVFKIALTLVVSTLVMADAAFVSCSDRGRGDQAYQPEPYYQPGDISNYEQLQQVMSALDEDICFPDLSDYDELTLRCEIIYDSYDAAGKAGYSLAFYDPYETYNTMAGNSLINSFDFLCLPESQLSKNNFIPETSYRGVPCTYADGEYFDHKDGIDLQYGLPHFGSLYSVYCEFWVDGYYYSMTVAVRAPADDLSAMGIGEVNEYIEKGRAEAMAIIDNVLDQKGLPKETMPDHSPPSRRNPQPADSGSTADAAAPTTSG